MPFAERLTWSGIFLHAGDLPGYPSSHGCVHLPLAFAKDLFETTQAHDTTVVITESTSHSTEAAPIEQLLRIVEADGSSTQAPNNVLWEPNKSKDGSVAIVISGLDKRIEILRGGVLIGQAPINFANPETPLPEALYVKLQPSPGKPSPDWSAVLIADSQATSPSQLLGEIQVPAPVSNELNKTSRTWHPADYNAELAHAGQSLRDKFRRSSGECQRQSQPVDFTIGGHGRVESACFNAMRIQTRLAQAPTKLLEIHLEVPGS